METQSPESEFRSLPEFVYVLNSKTAKLAHPLTWVLVGSAIFIFSWLFPPVWYEAMFSEKDRLFLDLRTFAFAFCCILLTVAGMFVALATSHSPATGFRVQSSIERARLTQIGIIAVCTLLNLGALYTLYRSGSVAAFFQAATQGSGRLIGVQRELTGDSEGLIWMILLVPTAFTLPLVYHYVRTTNRGDWIRIAFWGMAFLYVLAAVFASKRNFLARPMFGCLCLYLVYPTFQAKSMAKGVAVCFFAALGLVVIFLGLAVVRNGIVGLEQSIAEIIRYIVGPYNTASFLINDELRFPGERTGTYWTQFTWKFPVVGNLLHLEDYRLRLLGPIAPFGDQERGYYLYQNGIRTGTAISAFGASYMDFGFFGCLPFFLVGFLSGCAWRLFLKGSSWGLCFFPVLAYSFFEWRANLLFPAPYFGLEVMIATMIMIACTVENMGLNAQRSSIRM